MADGAPSHRRVRLGDTLKTQRTRQGVSQAKLGQIVGRTQGWVNKIENAKIHDIDMVELDRMMEYLGITGTDASKLRELAMYPYDQRGLYMESMKDSILYHSFDLIAPRARLITAFHTEIFNGLIQSPDYVRRIFEVGGATDLDLAARARLEYQSRVLGADNPPHVAVFMSEGALRRNLGSPQAMVAQVRHMSEMVDSGRATIRFIPMDAPCQVPITDFVTYEFPPGVMADFVIVEIGAVGPSAIDDERSIKFYRDRLANADECARPASETPGLLARFLEENHLKGDSRGEV